MAGNTTASWTRPSGSLFSSRRMPTASKLFRMASRTCFPLTIETSRSGEIPPLSTTTLNFFSISVVEKFFRPEIEIPRADYCNRKFAFPAVFDFRLNKAFEIVGV